MPCHGRLPFNMYMTVYRSPSMSRAKLSGFFSWAATAAYRAVPATDLYTAVVLVLLSPTTGVARRCKLRRRRPSPNIFVHEASFFFFSRSRFRALSLSPELLFLWPKGAPLVPHSLLCFARPKSRR